VGSDVAAFATRIARVSDDNATAGCDETARGGSECADGEVSMVAGCVVAAWASALDVAAFARLMAAVEAVSARQKALKREGWARAVTSS
jgi:hypothetical protein